jgi:SPX domain protein involved in polyphosphate accumulation
MHDFETKYVFPNANALKVKTWLEKRFEEDPEYPQAVITSIYFDTLHMKYLEEKENSDHIKSKFRIRWYEDPKSRIKSDICFFEFKHKIGEKRFKRRVKTENLYSTLPLESSKFYSVLDNLRLYEGVVLDHIFPSYIVSYTRSRFIIPGTDIRLCVDYNINVPKTNLLLTKGRPKKAYLSDCVFELKGPTAVLPKELLPLEQMGARKDAFSKYQRCFHELIRTH